MACALYSDTMKHQQHTTRTRTCQLLLANGLAKWKHDGIRCYQTRSNPGRICYKTGPIISPCYKTGPRISPHQRQLGCYKTGPRISPHQRQLGVGGEYVTKLDRKMDIGKGRFIRAEATRKVWRSFIRSEAIGKEVLQKFYPIRRAKKFCRSFIRSEAIGKEVLKKFCQIRSNWQRSSSPAKSSATHTAPQTPWRKCFNATRNAMGQNFQQWNAETVFNP